MDDYMSSYEKAGGRASKDTLRVINAHILPTFGKLLVVELTRAMIQEWLENLASTPARIRSSPNGKQKFKQLPDEYEAKRRRRSTANRILTVLKAALNKAADLEKVNCSVNAWTLVKPFRKADAARVRFLSIEDQKVIVDACEPDFRKLVQAALFTGARYGELSRLMHVRDFDERNGQIYITSESKSEKCRHIVLSEEGIAFFKELVSGRKGSERMFLMTNGRAWISGEQMRPMRKAVKAAKIEGGLTFHELRHTYASTLIMAGIPVSVVAMQLGHT
ncbi:MAG TPA: tyrosine-type recombinase/integrase, partial [Methanosarcina vacuolata]|nr:tyrosine-type recombinase/integrase [Methanosarcina vacuolata]